MKNKVSEKHSGELLVVDDTPANLKLLMDILTAKGYKIRPASDGNQALAAVAVKKPELILLDIKMPGIDGYEVCRRLKEDVNTKDIPVIFISAHDTIDDRVKGFDLGGVDYIIKPFQEKDVLVRVHNHIQLYRMQMNLEGIVKERTAELRSEITERKHAQEALSEANTIINRSPAVAFLWKNKEGWPVEFVSKNIKKLSGYSDLDFLEGKISYSDIIHSDDIEKVGEEVARHSEKSGLHAFTHEPYRIITKNKEIKWIFDQTYIRRDSGGIITHFEGIVYDITERKHSDEELKKAQTYITNIINSMPSVLIGVDKAGLVTQWNEEAQRITGLTGHKALGQHLDKVFPHLAAEMEQVQKAIEMREVCTDPKRSHQRDGETCYEDVTVYPLIANGVDGAVIRIDDITDKVRLEEMMIQSEKMLSVGGLAAGMAHEINNPLAGIIQTINVMQERLDDIEMPANQRAAKEIGIHMNDIKAFMEKRGILRMITTINEAGNRVSNIVDNMLGFARKSDSTISSHNPVNLLDKTLELAATDYDLKKQYDFKTIKIQKDYEDDLPMIPCEGAKIQQVLLNILSNGAQAMQEVLKKNSDHKPIFMLRLSKETQTNMLCMEIEDNGPGIDKEIRKRIFEPFFTTKPVGMGTGLGLSVSYFIITENHGGTMDVMSEVGKGTTFIIHLPLEGIKV